MSFYFQQQPYIPPRRVGFFPILPRGGVVNPIWAPPIVPLRDVDPMPTVPILGREQGNEQPPPNAASANAIPVVPAQVPSAEALVPPVVPAEAPAAALAPVQAEVEAQAQPPIVPPPVIPIAAPNRVIVRGYVNDAPVSLRAKKMKRNILL